MAKLQKRYGWHAWTAAVAGLLLASAAPAQVATQVEATLLLRLADGTPGFTLFQQDFEGVGVAPIAISGGPNDFQIAVSSIDLSTASSQTPFPRQAAFFPPGFPPSHVGLVRSPRIGAGSLTALGLGLGSASIFGGLPLQGRIIFGQATGPFVSTSMTLGGQGPGVGGPLIAATNTSFGAARISLQGAPWTVGTVSLQSQTSNGALHSFTSRGFVHGPASNTSSVLSGGTVQLVTPLQIQSETFLTPLLTWGVFGELTLHFVPEPSANLMWLAGAAFLAVLGWRRRHPR